MNAVILCRYGEIFLKRGNRTRFEQILVNRIQEAVARIPGTRVSVPHGRILVHVPEVDLEEACRRVERVFGLVSLSPAIASAPNMEAIAEAAIRATRAAVARDPRLGVSFRVDARRSDKSFPLRSLEIAREIGAAIFVATGIRVDLHGPTLSVGIEVGAEVAHVFVDSRPGPGGLPVGSSGRALLLLSGGIDSPVAAWLAAKRGLAMDALYFHSPPFIGEQSKDKVLALGRALARWQVLSMVHVANFTEVQKKLRDAGPAPLAVVLYRRMMMRVADLIADRIGAGALITGENLGQVASQTMTNMGTIEAAARHLILRPLLTYDKMETTALARRIGTYDTSALPFEDCCSLFVPPHPATGARLPEVERAEERLDLPAEARAVAEGVERIDVREVYSAG